MKSPLLIGGNEILRDTFKGNSLFYDNYNFTIANAGMLDIAAAIGVARNARRPSLSERLSCLQKAADSFSFTDTDVEHAVKVLGMPISIIKRHFENIPDILRGIPQAVGSRFARIGETAQWHAERLSPNMHKILTETHGFAYAVTPGNDVRASAMVAANLCVAGLPFIIKASKEDAATPLVIRALINGGFDPAFCNLVYFDSSASDASKKHFKILDACSFLLSFGSDETIDKVLRFEFVGKRSYLELTDFIKEGNVNLESLKSKLEGNPAFIKKWLVEKEDFVDHFEGKKVIRHGCGNCALVASGLFTEATADILQRSFEYAIGCNAAKSAMVVDSRNWFDDASDFVSSMVIGDPLDEKTQIGFINPQNLDYLDHLLKQYSGRVELRGGKRLSQIQAQPLLIQAQDDITELFGQEIPAYVLAVRNCDTTNEAVNIINKYTGNNMRLAVSFLEVRNADIEQAISKIKAHAVLVNEPTTTVVPFFHEGNDYALKLGVAKLVIMDSQ